MHFLTLGRGAVCATLIAVLVSPVFCQPGEESDPCAAETQFKTKEYAEAVRKSSERVATIEGEKKQKLGQLDSQFDQIHREIAKKKSELERRHALDIKNIEELQKMAAKGILGSKGSKEKYKAELDRCESEYVKAIASLDDLAISQTDNTSAEAKGIVLEYNQQIAKARAESWKSERETITTQYQFPDDTSPRFKVREIRFEGNSLIPTSEIIESMPVVFDLTVKDSNSLPKRYDFGVLQDVIIAPGAEQQVSQTLIQGLAEYVLYLYQTAGYAGVHVYVPKDAVSDDGKSLKDDILVIRVIEGRIDRIEVRSMDLSRKEVSKGYLNGTLVKVWSPVQAGEPIRKEELDKYLLLLNQNPDRRVEAVLSKGSEPNTVGLTYEVYEGSPWHWYTQVDNSGTGKQQWAPRVGMVNTNLTGHDDLLSVMFQAHPESINDQYALFGLYEFPLLQRLRMSIFSGYNRFAISPSNAVGINFLGQGSFTGTTLRFNLLQAGKWLIDILGTATYETSVVHPTIGLETNIHMAMAGPGIEIHKSDDTGDTSLGFRSSSSFNTSKLENFEEARLETNTDFTIYTLSASHRQFIDVPSKVHEVKASGTWTFSDERLIPAKMTSFGGLYSVRGYAEDELVADGGLTTSLQYRFDLTRNAERSLVSGSKQDEETLSLFKRITNPNISLVAFTDYGLARTKDPLPGEFSSEELWGVGTGVIVEVKRNFESGIYYSWPLLSTSETDAGDGRWNFNFLLRW